MERDILTLATRRGAPIIRRGEVDPRTLRSAPRTRLAEYGRVITRVALADEPAAERAAALRELAQRVAHEADALETGAG